MTNRDRIQEILLAYRPGEGLEADPEVAQALAAAREDPALGEWLRDIAAFDRVFADKVQAAPVPDGLQASILAAARAQAQTRSAQPAADTGRGKVLRWFHPAAFAAAAAILILLALSFTFWQRPGAPGAPMTAQASIVPNQLVQTALGLYASMRPDYRSQQGGEIRHYLASNGGTMPAKPPRGFCWTKTFACSVVKADGASVTLICFEAPDQSRSMHLFIFPRSAFPGLEIPERPQVQRSGSASFAAWAEDEQIHVLFSDKGEDNLRAVLEI